MKSRFLPSKYRCSNFNMWAGIQSQQADYCIRAVIKMMFFDDVWIKVHKLCTNFVQIWIHLRLMSSYIHIIYVQISSKLPIWRTQVERTMTPQWIPFVWLKRHHYFTSSDIKCYGLELMTGTMRSAFDRWTCPSVNLNNHNKAFK